MLTVALVVPGVAEGAAGVSGLLLMRLKVLGSDGSVATVPSMSSPGAQARDEGGLGHLRASNLEDVVGVNV